MSSGGAKQLGGNDGGAKQSTPIITTNYSTGLSPLPISKIKPHNPVLQRGHTLAKGLMACWPFSEGGGDTVRDLVQHADATPIDGSLGWGRSEKGRVMRGQVGQIEGVSTTHFPSPATIPVSHISFCVQFKADTTPTSNSTERIVYWGEDWQILWDHGNTSYQHSITVLNGGYPIATMGELVADEWYIVVGTYESGDLRCYVNGNLTGQSSTPTGDLTAAAGSLAIGNKNSSVFEQFVGDINYAAMWDRVLTPTEVKEMAIDPFGLIRQDWQSETSITVDAGQNIAIDPISIPLEVPNTTQTFGSISVGIEGSVINLEAPDTSTTFGGLSILVEPSEVILGSPNLSITLGELIIPIEASKITLSPANITIDAGASPKSIAIPAVGIELIPADLGITLEGKLVAIESSEISLESPELGITFGSISVGVESSEITLNSANISIELEGVQIANIDAVGVELFPSEIGVTVGSIIASMDSTEITLIPPDFNLSNVKTINIDPTEIILGVPETGVTLGGILVSIETPEITLVVPLAAFGDFTAQSIAMQAAQIVFNVPDIGVSAFVFEPNSGSRPNTGLYKVTVTIPPNYIPEADESSILNMFDENNPDIGLFDILDSESITLGGSPVLIFKYEQGEDFDDVYMEDRNKAIHSDPITVPAHFDPKAIEENLTEFMTELTNDQVFVFNRTKVITVLGRAPIAGDIIQPKFQNMKFEVFEVQEDAFDAYGVYHLNVFAKLLRDSPDIQTDPLTKIAENKGLPSLDDL